MIEIRCTAGGRTSASDAAVAELKATGVSIKINNVTI